MHRNFFKEFSRNPDYVKKPCNEMENPLNSAIGKCMFIQ